jgi:hypothetical protein
MHPYTVRIQRIHPCQGVLSGSRGVPRDRAIKVVASLCDMAASDLLASPDWPRLEAALARAQAEAGADWAAFTRLVVPCLGSIEARQDYLAELVGSVAAAEHSGETDIARGWVSGPRKRLCSAGRVGRRQGAAQAQHDAALMDAQQRCLRCLVCVSFVTARLSFVTAC